jgi:hypothetical protein
MNIVEYYDSIDLLEIKKMISECQEENLYLEFKTVNHPVINDQNREYDFKNISEVISGFANSNGGIVIWGIKAKKNSKNQDVAFQNKPIKELTRFLNILNRLEGQCVTPTVNGIIHKKIETKEDEGYIKTYIPPSETAPHMANLAGKHYYKRSGDSFYICEHFDIIDILHRKTYANLELIISEDTYVDKNVGQGNQTRYEKKISLINTGKNFARAPYLKIDINSPFQMAQFGLDGNGNIGLFKKREIPFSPYSCSYIGGQDIVLYPNIIYDIDKIRLEISNTEVNIPDLNIEYTLVAENMEKVVNSLIAKLK